MKSEIIFLSGDISDSVDGWRQEAGSRHQYRKMRCWRVAEVQEHRTRHQARQASISHTARCTDWRWTDEALRENYTNYHGCRTEWQPYAHDALFCWSTVLAFQSCRTLCYSHQLLIANVELSDNAWDQATLPAAIGELVIRSAKDVGLPVVGFQVTCAHHSTTATSFTRCIEWFNIHCSSVRLASSSDGLYTAAQQPFIMKEKFWDEPLVPSQELSMLSAAPDQAGKGRLSATAAPHSGVFLDARPCSSLGTRLDNSSLHIAIALRLGAPVCLPHTCVRGVSVDNLSCRKSAGRLSRHSTVNDLIKRALLSAEISSKLELLPQNEWRPDGMSRNVVDTMEKRPMSGLGLHVSRHTSNKPPQQRRQWTRNSGLRSWR